ncbi:serine/arginine repetitive matrix protein 1-like [Equus przewalskii]|uniref:Serine/arginine repetitive matrix protein 1-like n=1 Tax=Equus przewalskii TaxID=9798 RepID=A0ABM4P2K1_EQUPR
MQACSSHPLPISVTAATPCQQPPPGAPSRRRHPRRRLPAAQPFAKRRPRPQKCPPRAGWVAWGQGARGRGSRVAQYPRRSAAGAEAGAGEGREPPGAAARPPGAAARSLPFTTLSVVDNLGSIALGSDISSRRSTATRCSSVRLHTPTGPAGQTLRAAALHAARRELRAERLESCCLLRARRRRQPRRLRSGLRACGGYLFIFRARLSLLLLFLGEGGWGGGAQPSTHPGAETGHRGMEPHARTLPGLKPITWGGPGASEERQGRDVSATSRASASPAAERRPPLPPPPLLPHTERRRPQPPETSRSALATLPSAARAPSLTGTAAELGRQSRHNLPAAAATAPASAAASAPSSCRPPPPAPRPPPPPRGAHPLPPRRRSCGRSLAGARVTHGLPARPAPCRAVPAPRSVFSAASREGLLLPRPVPAQVSVWLQGWD